MTERELVDCALKNLLRAMHEAGRGLPRSWIAEGDPDLHSLRDTEEWNKLKRRLSTEDEPDKPGGRHVKEARTPMDRAEESESPASREIAKEAASLAELASTADPSAFHTEVARRLGEEPRYTVDRPETPLRPTQVRQRAWGTAALLLAVAAVIVLFLGLPWLLGAALVVTLVGLAANAGYRVHLARTERWPDLPTSRDRSEEAGSPEPA
jgi:hypothetical protein